jgi:hypothetical protein
MTAYSYVQDSTYTSMRVKLSLLNIQNARLFHKLIAYFTSDAPIFSETKQDFERWIQAAAVMTDGHSSLKFKDGKPWVGGRTT